MCLFTQPLFNIILCTVETAIEKLGEKIQKLIEKNLSVQSQFF